MIHSLNGLYIQQSADFMSNATTMDIVSHLAENHVHLPNAYGSYKFFDWNIVPPQTRTWWLKNYFIVFGVFIVILIIGLAASVTWLIRRRQQSLVSYKPVDSAAPEQEFQPLSPVWVIVSSCFIMYCLMLFES